MALKVGELFASFNLDTSGVGGAVSAAEKELSSLGKGLVIGGAAMTAAVTVPLKQAATSIYKAGSGFDAQMSKVFAIIGEEATGSAEVMESLRQKALDMGSTTAFTASEAGEAMQYMAMAGWKTNDMLAGLSPIMDLAAASGEDLGTVSDIVTDALTAFGLTAEDTAHFTDVLAAASSNSNTNVAIMGESFKYLAPLAGSLAYSVDDVAVALGLMANAGIKGSMAGTSVRELLSNLIKPTEAQTSALEALHVSLYDSNGAVKGLAELMVDLRKAAKDSGFDMHALREKVSEFDDQLASGTITEEEYNAQVQKLTEGNGEFLKAISDLAGARGLSGLLAIMNATEDDFLKLTGAVNGSAGAAKTMAQVMLDNAQGEVTLFNSALEGLEITLWDLAEDGFRNAVKSATSLVDSFRNADEATLAGTLRLAALAAAAGPVMMGMGGIISILPDLATAFTALTGPGALLAIGMVALGAAAIDSGNSMGKTFAKGAIMAGSKVRQLGKDVKKQLPTLTKNMSAFLKSISVGIEYGLPGIMEGMTGILTTGISAIADNMGNIADVARTIVRTLADGIIENMPEFASSALDLLTGLGSELIRNIPVVQGSAYRILTTVINAINNAPWGEIGTKLNTAIQDALKETGTWFKQLAMGDQYTEDAAWADVGFALANNVLEGIRKAFGNTKDFIGSLLLGGSYDPNEDWSTFGGKIIDKVFEGVDGAISGATDFVGGILDGLASMFTEENISAASDTLSGIVSRIITAAANEIPNLVEHTGTILTKIGELIFGKEGEKGLAESALEGAGNLAGAIINAIVSALPNVEQAGESILNTLAGILSASNIQSFMEGATSLATNLLTAITTAIGGLGGMASNLLSAIGDALFGTNAEGERSLAASAIEGAGALAGSLIQAIADSIPGVETAAESIINAIADILAPSNIKDIGEATKTLAGNILTGIANGIRALGASAANILTAISDAIFGTDKNGDSAMTAGVEALTGIVQTIFDTVTNDVIPSMGDAVGGILTAFAGFFTPEKLGSLGNGLGDLAGSVLTGVVDTLVSAIDTVLEITDETSTDEVFAGILTGIESFAGKVIEALAEAIPKVLGAGGKILGKLAELFAPEKIGGVITEAQSVAQGLMDAVLEAFTGTADEANKLDLTGTFTGIVGSILDGLIAVLSPENIEAVSLNIGSFITGLLDSITNSLSSGIAAADESDLFGKFITLIQNIVTGLVNALPAAFRAGENVVSAGFKLGTELVQSIADSFSGIGTGIDFGGLASSFITSLTGVLGSALTFGSEAMTAGAKIAGSLIDSLIGAFDTTIETDGVSDIGDRLRTLLQNIIAGITAVIPNLFVLGGKAISAGAVLAGDLVNSLTKGFTDESLSLNYAGIMQSLVTGLTSAVENLPKLLKDTLSAGAQIANAIMGSITTALADTANSGVGTALATAGTNLVHGLLTSITNFGENEDVQGFIKNLGEGLRDSLYMIGEFTGDLVLNLFSVETLKKVFEAGKSIVGLLIQGIGVAIDGVSGLLDGIVSSILDRLGLIDKEAIKNELEVGKQLSAAIEASITDSSGEVKHTAETAFATILAAFAAGEGDEFENIISGTGIQSIYDDIVDYLSWNNAPKDVVELQTLFENAFAESGLDFKALMEKLPDDFWQVALDSLLGNANKGEGKPILDMLLDMLLGEGISDAAKQSAEQEDAAFAKALQDTVFSKTEESMIDALEGASAEATAEMQGTFANEKTPVANGAAEIGDAAVRQFLLTMSAENGAAIATNFTGAITASILADGEAILNASDEAATAALSAFSDTLSANSGYSIGLNFSLGIAEGIADGVDAITQAASDAANAAVSASASTLDEHSPSKRARDEIGLMYGKGLAIGILDSMPAVMSASRKLSSSMHDQMDVSSERMGGMSIRRQPVYAGSAGRTSTVNNPTYVHNHNNNLNIDRYYQNSAEDVDYLARRIREEERRDQAGRGM